MLDLVPIAIFFFAVIDPIGTVPVFIAVTTRFNQRQKQRVALKAFAYSCMVLLFFVLAGEVLLNSIGIPLPAFQIAGGLVLLLFALTMIFGDGKPEREMKDKVSTTDKAIFPLAMPSLASPGAILAAVLATENASYTWLEQLQVSMVMVAVLGIALLLMLSASYVYRIIGRGGASIISRVMGLILSSLAVTNMLEGIANYFSL